MSQAPSATGDQAAANTVGNGKVCDDCGAPFGFFSTKYHCQAPGCRKVLCSNCSDWPVLPADCSGADKVISTCKACFCRMTTIDRSRDWDAHGPEGAPAILFLHGGGSCRCMFDAQIEELSKEFRCYTLDFPGHGAAFETELTLQSATDRVVTFVRQHVPQGGRMMLVGASLGGYIGCHVIGEHPELFSGALICDAGQDVGPNRGMAASMGLVFLGAAVGWVRKQKLVSSLVNQAPHVPAKYLDHMLQAGYYFNSGPQQIQVLKSINPEEGLRKFEGPILFINGEKDHRDSEQRWLAATKNGKLIVYEETDHFLTHDERTFSRFIQDIRSLAASVAAASH